MSTEHEWLSTGAAARLLGVTSETVRARAVAGLIEGARRRGERGKWEVPRSYVRAELSRRAAGVDASDDALVARALALRLGRALDDGYVVVRVDVGALLAVLRAARAWPPLER